MTHFEDHIDDEGDEPDDPFAAPSGGLGTFWLAVVLSIALLCAGALWFYSTEIGLTLDNPQDAAVEGEDGIATYPVKFAGETLSVAEPNFRRIVRNGKSQIRSLELALPWPPPTLAFLGSKSEPAGELSLHDGLFVTIHSHSGQLTREEKLANVYSVYFAGEPERGPAGLTRRDFKDGTVYEGQELHVGDTEITKAHYICFTEDEALSPALCRGERIAWQKFSVVYRFHRSHLSDWQAIEARVTALLAGLRK